MVSLSSVCLSAPHLHPIILPLVPDPFSGFQSRHRSAWGYPRNGSPACEWGIPRLGQGLPPAFKWGTPAWGWVPLECLHPAWELGTDASGWDTPCMGLECNHLGRGYCLGMGVPLAWD